MSRKSKKLTQAAPVLAKLYVFAVVDSVSNACVEVAAPVFYQLIRRGWATQAGVENKQDRETKRPVERRIARLVSRLSFRSLKPSPNGNLCFKSLLESTGVSVRSWWSMVEEAWTLEGFPRSFCPKTWEERLQLQQDRQAAIEAECQSWGVPEPQPIRIGASL